MALVEVTKRRLKGAHHRPLLPYLKHNSVAMAVLCAVIMFALLAGEEAYRLVLRTQPTDRWIEYHSVNFVAEEPDARDGLGGLRFISDAQIKRSGLVEWNDVLRCRTSDVEEFVFFASYSSDAELPKGPRRESPWVFNGPYPRDPEALCFVTSSISITDFEVTKKVTILTDVFSPVG